MRASRQLGFALSVVMAMATPVLRAQEGLGNSRDSFVGTTFGVQDGLPEQIVQALAQTPDGYLWVGTTGGLARFDGSHFTPISSSAVPTLYGNSVFALLTTSNGNLWIGTEGSGLWRYHNGSLRAYGAAEGLTDSFVRAVSEDSSGAVLVGTNNGFFGFSGDRLERLDGQGALPILAVNAIAWGPKDALWIGGSRLMSRQNGEWRQWHLPGGENGPNRVKSLLVTHDGAVWAGAVSGLYRSPDGRAPFVAVPGIHGTVRALRLTADGLLWMSIVGRGGFAYSVKPTAPFLQQQVKLNYTVLSYLQDHEGDLWVGTQSGLVRLSRTPTSAMPLEDSRDSDFGTVYRDPEGPLWAASAHLFQIRKDHAEIIHLPRLEQARAKVRNVLRDRHRTLWFGTEGSGLWSLHDGAWRHFTTSDGLVNNFTRVLLESRDGSLWIGTDEGVSWLVHGRFVNYGLHDGLAYFSIRSMLEDQKGDVWIGTEQGLSRWHDGALVHDHVTESMCHERVWAIYQDAAGGLWFGTRDDGLFHLRDGRLTHWTVRDGLASNAVYSIVEDSAGRFWMSGSQRVAMMRRAELEREPQPHYPPQVTLFHPPTGSSTEMFGGMQCAGIEAGGELWFPSNEGLVRIAPQAATQLPMPRMMLDRISSDGKELIPGSALTLPSGSGRLQITYAPVMLRSQDRMRFRYQLESFDHDWNEAGIGRTADYTNLPPGQYEFRVQGYEMEDPGRVSEAILRIVKLPAFYATWWFRVLAVIAAVCIVFAFHRLRVRRLKQQFVAVLNERNRLAREMHDTLIQGCTSVSVALEATISSSESQARPVEPLIDLARDQIRETLREARQAVWNLRHGQEQGATDATQELQPLIERMCAQIASEFRVPISCHHDGHLPRCTQGATHEVLMIIREAVHNAVLHGKPSAVNLTLGTTRRECKIEIADDGHGFDPEQALAQTPGHFGVTGMRERALRIGGQFSIRSQLGEGTRVALRVPLRSLLREQRFG